MSGKASKMRRIEPRQMSEKVSKEIEVELFQAAMLLVSVLSKKGVWLWREDIYEPQKRHYPRLLNLEDFENWLKNAESYAIDKRLKSKGERTFVPEPIEVDDIFKDVWTKAGHKECQRIIFLGSAGIGKTTLLNSLAEHYLQKQKLVIMPEFRTFSPDDEISPAQALLSHMFPDSNSERMELRYQWIQENPEKVVILVDSLDTMPFDLNEERPAVSHSEKAIVGVIAHNLLAGKLLPGSPVISSSREYKVRHLHPSVRPDRCIVIDGLKDESVRDLFDGFLGKNKGTEAKKYIEKECPDIWSLLSIPVFLLFTVFGFVEETEFRPKVMSEIITKHFSCLIRSTHALVEDIPSVLRKLMPMCYEGVRQGQVLFKPEDLMRFGVEAAEASDLGILIPQSGGSYLSSKLMQNERFFLYFNHQTQQEFLAALHILSMNNEEFEVFLHKEFFEANFTVVRRLMCGILFSDTALREVSVMTEITDIAAKRSLLLEGLRNALRQKQTKATLVEIIIDLNETNEGAMEVIRTEVKDIDLRIFPLTPSHTQAVASVMRQCQCLDEVNLASCDLNEEKMKLLESAVTQSNLKINRLVASGNDLGVKGTSSLAKLAKHCGVKMLDFGKCKLETGHLDAFLESAGGVTFEDLYTNSNSILDPSGWFKVGKLVGGHCHEIRAADCKMNAEKLRSLNEGMAGSKLEVFDVGGNDELESRDWEELGKMIKQHDVKVLGAGLCNAGAEKVQNFLDGLEDKKINSLSLSDVFFSPRYSSILLELLNRITDELNLEGWEINENEEKELQDELDEIRLPKLTVILRNGKKLKATSLTSDEKHFARVGDAYLSRLEEALHKLYQRKARKRRIITPQGGQIELYEHRMLVPPGAVSEPIVVEISLDSNPEHFPSFAVPICLIFGCKQSHFKAPVTVHVPTWFKPTGDEPFTATLLAKSRSKPEWRALREVSITSSANITYTTSHFCDHIFAISFEQVGKGSFTFYNDVWMNKENAQIVPFFCKKSRRVLEVVRKDLEADHKRIISLPREPVIDFGGTVKIGITCDCPSNVTMQITGKKTIKISKKIKGKDSYFCYFKLVPHPEELKYEKLYELKYKVDVFDARGQIDDEESFTDPMEFKWPLAKFNEQKETAQREEQEKSIVVNISAEKVDVRHVTTKNYADSYGKIEYSESGVQNTVSSSTYSMSQNSSQ